MIKLLQLISELGINNPNATPQEVWKYYFKNIGFKSYIKEIEPIFKKVPEWRPNVASNLSILDWFENISQKSLNLIYKDLKQFAKSQNINELEVNRPIQTWDVRRGNWPNLSSKLFDRIKEGDRIIDPDFIGYVYEIDYDQLLDETCINYADENGPGDKFLTRSWFDAVSKED